MQRGQKRANALLHAKKSGQRSAMTQHDRMTKPVVQWLVLYHLQINKNNFSDNRSVMPCSECVENEFME